MRKTTNILILVIIHYSEENKKVIGTMKDEASGVPINEFIGLRSKMYSYCLDDKYIKKMQRLLKINDI